MRKTLEYHQIFHEYLAKNPFTRQPEALYDPANYIMSLGGKRLRPLLVLMGCDLFDNDMAKALPTAMAVEIFHNFTLVHDDIMDNAPLRRGKPTVHVKYNTNIGILSGDVMLLYAYEFLRKTPVTAKKAARLLEIFNKMAIEVCEGQQMDMNFETQNNIELPEYIKMIELKTSVLIAAAFQMGALIGGASELNAKRLYEFGRNVGIAFQIQDDILDTFGDPEKFGKKVGGDIVQNKKTYLMIKALECANETQKTDLEHLITTETTDETAKINAVKAIYEATDVRKFAEAAMNEHLEIAFWNLEHTDIKNKEMLREWAIELMQREK